MEYQTLGPLEVRHGGVAVRLGGVKQRSLLALLLLRRNEVVSTDQLVDALWAGAPPPTARQSVHNFVASLRRTLTGSAGPSSAVADGGEPVLRTRPPGYQLDVRPGELDLERFRQMVDNAQRALDAGDAGAAARGFRVALDLWRGPFLADLAAAGVEWAHRPDLAEERLVAHELRIDADLARGRHHQVVAELEALVAAHPLRERFAGQLMLALYRCGRQADALSTYRATRATIVEQLGVEPGHDLRALQQAVLAHDPSIAAPAARSVAHIRDERRPVTVVVAAVDAPPRLTDRDDPEDVRSSLAAGLAIVRGAVEHAGGSVHHVLGSTALALFGVPRAREDDAERAVRAALAIRDRARAEARVARIAVATGQALLTMQPAAGEPAVTGQVVTAGVDLVQAAPAGRVVVTPATARATRRCITSRPMLLPAVGGHVPLPAREVLAVGPAGPGVHRCEPTAAWYGRERELDLLVARLERACRGDPQLVTIVGDAGSGKSRLIAEFNTGLRRRGYHVTWRTGRTCTPSAFNGRGALDAGLAPETPLVVLFEDLHRADDALLDRIANLPEHAGAAAILVLATARPELLGRRPWWGTGRRSDTLLRLHPLPDAAMTALVGDLLGTHGVPGELTRPVVEHAEGNPLFAEDYVRLLADANDEGSGVGPVCAAPVTPLPLPESVHTIIAARLDRLSDEDRRVLEDAAVVGRVAWTGAIAAAGDHGDRARLARSLRRLERRELVRCQSRSRVVGQDEYHFTHGLVREVAYVGIPRAERAEKHLRVAVWMEALQRVGAADHAKLLAHHRTCARQAGPARA